MPNHLHGIIVIVDDCRGDSRIAPTVGRKSIGRLIGAFQTESTKRINQEHNSPGAKLWQRNYYACPDAYRGSHYSRRAGIKSYSQIYNRKSINLAG